MNFKRVYHSVRLAMSISGGRRAKYLKKNNILGEI